jgi:protein-tyrosine kinase
MSRLFEALSGLKTEHRLTEVIASAPVAPPTEVPPAPPPQVNTEYHTLKLVPLTIEPLPVVPPVAVHEAEVVQEAEILIEPAPKLAEIVETPAVLVNASPESRLVAWTDSNSLGAEKFRALVTRFDHLRSQRQLRSFQVTSSVINEGKTLVSANVAVTLAKYSGVKTLLVEGDLHRPTLANLLGLGELRGLNHWWSDGAQDLGNYVHRLNGMPLWFLPAGKPSDQPSDLLRSARFAKVFTQLAGQFEWTVVDSTPMLPIVDVNLWSRLLDGTLLVVREGMAPVKALKKGLQALDNPKLIGVVVNEATEFDHVGYKGQYYGGSARPKRSVSIR